MNLEEEFENNLELAQEENPKMTLDKQIELAKQWTIDDAIRTIARIAEQRRQKRIEGVNKAFYP